MTGDLVVATDTTYFLAEGPIWDPVRSRVLWVDIPAGNVLSGVLRDDGTIEVLESLEVGESAGAVAVSDRGDRLVAGRHRLLVIDVDGAVASLPPIESGPRRFNDGKPDPAGRFLVGTLSSSGHSEQERLLQIDRDGSTRVIDTDLTLSNGLGWTRDSRLFYNVDTERRLVYRRPYDVATGATGPREVFLTFDTGFPDGLTIDENGFLWIAMWGLGEVRRYSPAATLDRTIEVPAPHTSSLSFVGPDLDTLVITTARQDLTDETLAEFPLSGRLFTINPDVRGFPQPLWSGLPTPTTEKQGTR
ncbi:SMP-30/gluconolactonase/LRE family protein [Microbacterium mangrovi]|uniref:SMP-30/gluconolactonase/LRE family protein n=1 Tax=Microbacterium mangrovi TaxID=1348253 RepID=UPI000AFD68F6|nr:SMP-30/gluconolactonase/LRE family protein [Microbacterium mangrovi]